MGVSESSIKRWADVGALKVVRTIGGHRRIPLTEAVQFVRDSRAVLAQPAILGLRNLPVATRGRRGGVADGEQLADCLIAGEAAEVRGFVVGLYLGGSSVAAIVDGPLRTAMQRVGELWHHDPEGIFLEHRATDICIQALNQLRVLMAPGEDARVALGGAPTGDPYLLPSLAVATTLDAEGYRAINLGPETTVAALARAIGRERPAIVWVSVSTDLAAEVLARELDGLARAARASEAHLIVGGRAIETASITLPPDVQLARSVGEAAAFARGLAAGGGRA